MEGSRGGGTGTADEKPDVTCGGSIVTMVFGSIPSWDGEEKEQKIFGRGQHSAEKLGGNQSSGQRIAGEPELLTNNRQEKRALKTRRCCKRGELKRRTDEAKLGQEARGTGNRLKVNAARSQEKEKSGAADK